MITRLYGLHGTGWRKRPLCYSFRMPAVLEASVIQRNGDPASGVLLRVEAPEVAATCRPGQFVMVGADPEFRISHPLLKRALAVYDVPPEHPATIVLLLKVVGDGTRRLANLHPGHRLSLVGPLGNGFDLESARGKKNLIVAGGTGIASVFLLARALADSGEEVTLFYGGRRSIDLVGLTDWEGLNVAVRTTTEDGTAGEQGLVTRPLAETLSSGGNFNLFTCGPNPMMQAVATLAAEARVPCQLSVESKMACGFGVCLGCSVKTRRFGFRLSCTHGPVFEAADFVWELPVGRGQLTS